jgi:hypothetical protein
MRRKLLASFRSPYVSFDEGHQVHPLASKIETLGKSRGTQLILGKVEAEVLRVPQTPPLPPLT